MSKVKDLYVRHSDGTLEKTKALEGLSAYDSAVLGGYTGTEAEFYQKLSDVTTKTYVDENIDELNQTIVDTNIVIDTKLLPYDLADMLARIIALEKAEMVFDYEVVNYITTNKKNQKYLYNDGEYIYFAGLSSPIERFNITGDTPVSGGSSAYANWGCNLNAGTNAIVRGIATDKTNTYLYLAVRQASGSAVESNINGSLVILNRSDLSRVANFDTTELYTGMVRVDDYLLIAERTKGWSVFDISNPTSPNKVWSSNTDWDAKHECQNIKVVTIDSITYACVIGFASAVYFYDISTPSNPILKATVTVGEAESRNIRFGHTYDGEIVDGSLYVSLAPTTNHLAVGDNFHKAGIAKFNLSDIANGSVTWTISEVPETDVVTTSYGDPQPTSVVKWGDFFVLNSAPQSTFYIFDKSLNYIGKYSIDTPTSDYFAIMIKPYADEDFLYLPVGNSANSEGTQKSVAYLYKLKLK